MIARLTRLRHSLVTSLAVTLVAGQAGCQAKIDAHVIAGAAMAAAPSPGSDSLMTRTFEVESPIGLNVDGSTSGLGLALAVAQDSATVPQFQLTVALRPAADGVPLYLALGSELLTLERPSTLTIPRSMLPSAVQSGAAVVSIQDAGGTRYILAPQALHWTETEAVVSTSQPIGDWAFVADPGGTGQAANYLVIASTGLASDESLRYLIRFSDQAVAIKNSDVALPESSLKQKTTGNETRSVSAPAGASGTFSLTLLEAPVNKLCKISPETGSSRGRVSVAIRCDAR